MNLLFLSFIPVIPHYGGIQRVTDLLATELAFRGYNIFYLYYEFRILPENYISKFPQYYLNTEKRKEGEYLNEWKEYIVNKKIDVIINHDKDSVDERKDVDKVCIDKQKIIEKQRIQIKSLQDSLFVLEKEYMKYTIEKRKQ